MFCQTCLTCRRVCARLQFDGGIFELAATRLLPLIALQERVPGAGSFLEGTNPLKTA